MNTSQGGLAWGSMAASLGFQATCLESQAGGGSPLVMSRATSEKYYSLSRVSAPKIKGMGLQKMNARP